MKRVSSLYQKLRREIYIQDGRTLFTSNNLTPFPVSFGDIVVLSHPEFLRLFCMYIKWNENILLHSIECTSTASVVVFLAVRRRLGRNASPYAGGLTCSRVDGCRCVKQAQCISHHVATAQKTKQKQTTSHGLPLPRKGQRHATDTHVQRNPIQSNEPALASAE